ncbi:hypothetical protein D3C78_484270 [compost metagenome]
MACLWRHFFELTDNATAVVDLNLFIARLPVQHVFIIAFDAELADIVGCGVVCQLAVFIQALNVFIVNLRNVANDVRQRRAVRIIAALITFHLNSREAILVHRKAGNLNFRQIGFDRNRGKTVGTCTLFLEGRDIVIGEIDYAFQRIQRVLHIIHFLRHHLDLVDGTV